ARTTVWNRVQARTPSRLSRTPPTRERASSASTARPKPMALPTTMNTTISRIRVTTNTSGTRRTRMPNLPNGSARPWNVLRPHRLTQRLEARARSPNRHTPQCFPHNRAAHLAHTVLALGECDGNLNQPEPATVRPPGKVNLKAVALRGNRVHVDLLQ